MSFPVRLSVIMPVHNAEKTIRSALVSTLLAMPNNSELLVFLDGCTDHTSEIVSSIIDPRLMVLSSATKIGVASALNRLIDAASGLYIGRMDADDLCLPWRFSLQLRRIQASNADFVFCNAVLFGTQLRPFSFMPQPPLSLGGDQVAWSLALNNPFMHPTMLATKAAMISLGGYRHCPAEDYDLWLRACVAGKKLKRTAGYGLLYRVHKNQLTQQKTWKNQHLEDGVTKGSRQDLITQLLKYPDSSSLDLNHRNLARHLMSGASDLRLRKKLDLIRMFGFKNYLRYGSSRAK